MNFQDSTTKDWQKSVICLSLRDRLFFLDLHLPWWFLQQNSTSLLLSTLLCIPFLVAWLRTLWIPTNISLRRCDGMLYWFWRKWLYNANLHDTMWTWVYVYFSGWLYCRSNFNRHYERPHQYQYCGQWNYQCYCWT